MSPVNLRLRGPESLSARLTFLVVALAVPILLVIALTYADVLSERRRAETASATQAARNGAAIVDGFLRDLESTTFAIAGLVGDTGRTFDQPTFGGYLASIIKQYPEVRAYFITDPDGKVIASASGEGIGLDLSSRSYMVALKGGATTVWSG